MSALDNSQEKPAGKDQDLNARLIFEKKREACENSRQKIHRFVFDPTPHRQTNRQHHDESNAGRNEFGQKTGGKHHVKQSRHARSPCRGEACFALPHACFCNFINHAGRGPHPPNGHGMHRHHVIFAKQGKTGPIKQVNKRRLGIHTGYVGKPPIHQTMGKKRKLGFIDVQEGVEEGRKA